MKRVTNFVLYSVAVFLMIAVIGIGLNGTTINGIPAQIISNLTAHGVVIGEGTGDIAVVAPGTTGLPLISQGSSADPIYAALGNAGLTNSSITVSTSGCVGGGGSVSLGGTITLTSSSCGGWTGVTNTTPGATPTWTLQNGDIAWTLSSNATPTITVVSGDQWVHHTAKVCQPASGGPYTITWPANVKGGMTIGTTASKCNMQMFVSYDGINLWGVDTGVINQ